MLTIMKVPSPHVSLRLTGILLCFALFCLNAYGAADTAAAHDWPAPNPASVAHWQSLRFGVFIHWGPVSLTKKEISLSRGKGTPIEIYDNLYKEFNPVKFNPDEWVAIAKSSGAKYIVLTTKHHDGFCLWDTKLTDYNIMQSPFKRDIVKALAEACRKQGMEFGVYYSIPDWYWPRGSLDPQHKTQDAYQQYLLGQITELLTNYGPMLTIWNDIPGSYGKRGAETIKLVRKLQPDILINNRTGDGGDYGTPEQRIGGYDIDYPWESCMTVSKRNQWSWGGEEDGVKALNSCLDMIINSAGGDGNVLLNVGPRPDGVIDPSQTELLKEIGTWMEKNGEGIYGTRGGPWKPTRTVASTRKDKTIYLFLQRLRNGEVQLPTIEAKVKSATLLSGEPVEATQNESKLTIKIPPEKVAPYVTMVKLQVDRPVMEIKSVDVNPPAPSKPTPTPSVPGTP